MLEILCLLMITITVIYFQCSIEYRGISNDGLLSSGIYWHRASLTWRRAGE